MFFQHSSEHNNEIWKASWTQFCAAKEGSNPPNPENESTLAQIIHADWQI